MPAMRLARLCERNVLYMRKGRPAARLRLPRRPGHFAAGHRQGPVGKVIDRTAHRFAGQVHLEKGRPFKAFLVLQPGGKVGFEFEARTAKKPADAKPKVPAAKPDFSRAEAVAVCPKCGGRMFETEYHYVCEKSQAEKRPCKFQVPRSLLQQAIDRRQLVKLIETGRTDLLSQFVSKNGKPFSAFLILDDAQKGGLRVHAKMTASAP